jgi:hypothetical protein
MKNMSRDENLVEKRKRTNRRAIKREGLMEERNRREGNARYAKLLMQVDTNRNQDKPKEPIKKMSEV